MAFEIFSAEKIATDVALRAINGLITQGGNIAKEYWTRYKARDAASYSRSLIGKGVQANSVRNFIFETRSASLYDIYVPTTIKDGKITGDELIQLLNTPVTDPMVRPSRAIAIVGHAGTGKSLFLKHAFFKLQHLDSAKIPLLIEARSFNRGRAESLARKIHEDIASLVKSASFEQIEIGLENGIFVILIDGMDEMKGTIQSHYEDEFVKFLQIYPMCPVLISSRPDPRIGSWSVDVRTIAPLDISAAEDLVARLPFHEESKTAFTSLLRGSLFLSHYQFASVPLLCTIMLLTFSTTGHIANSRHEFFEDAFAALWSKHDGLKPGFERHRYTKLQKNEFLRLMSAFALSSYLSAEFDMRESQIRQHFRIALRLSGLPCKEADFIRDLTISTSLAVQDGPYLRFCHLSFHEYFAAIFVCEVEDSVSQRLIEDLSDRVDTSNVLPLVLSMNPEKIERHWVAPHLANIVDVIEATRGNLRLYARTVIGEDGQTVEEIHVTMNKIRILYDFHPTLADLRAAADAAQGMRIKIGQLVKSSYHRPGVFEQDRSNFLDMGKRLREKYSRSMSALEELLRPMPK